MEDIPVRVLVASAGFLAGMIFGGTAQRTNFCTMGALSDIVFMGNYTRFRAWMLAIAVAMLISQGMDAAGLVELDARQAHQGIAGAATQAVRGLEDHARAGVEGERDGEAALVLLQQPAIDALVVLVGLTTHERLDRQAVDADLEPDRGLELVGPGQGEGERPRRRFVIGELLGGQERPDGRRRTLRSGHEASSAAISFWARS